MTEFERIRSLLNRNQSRLERFQNSTENTLTMLLKEITESQKIVNQLEEDLAILETHIQERKEAIAYQQENLSKIRETGTSLEAKTAGLFSQFSEKQKLRAILKGKLTETQSQLHAVTEELETHKAQHEKLLAREADLERDLTTKKKTTDQALKEKQEMLKEVQKEVQGIQVANPVTDFLLVEGEDSPELEIIALLLRQPESSEKELKQEVKVPPAIATRSIKNLEKKGLIKVTGTGKVQLAKDIE